MTENASSNGDWGPSTLPTDPSAASDRGGALVNTNGEVIGITSAIATTGSSGNVGVGFAIPSKMAQAVVDGIIAGQR